MQTEEMSREMWYMPTVVQGGPGQDVVLAQSILHGVRKSYWLHTSPLISFSNIATLFFVQVAIIIKNYYKP